MIQTRFTEMFDLVYPVMSAPMAHHSGGVLAAAVSGAGGLGSFGGVHTRKGPDWLRGEIATIRAATDRPFGIGFITPFLPFTQELFEAALAEAPAVVAFSFSDPEQWVDQVRAAGAKVMCQVQNFEDAIIAVDAGTDILVAQGNEAGGHTGTMSLLPLLAGIAAQHPDVPVLAAGGIGDGNTLAAALMAGADGAWLGTAFLATPEATEVHDVHKRLIVDSDGADTTFTSAYDIASGLPWPEGIAERVRRNSFTDEWADREAELRQRREEVSATLRLDGPDAPPDPENDAVLYGQSAAFVNAIRPAADVVREICEHAEQILRSRPTTLLS